MMQLKITKPGNLLSVVHEQEVSDSQASSVIALLKAPGLTYGETLAWLASRRPGINYADLDSPAGAGEDVEAFRG